MLELFFKEHVNNEKSMNIAYGVHLPPITGILTLLRKPFHVLHFLHHIVVSATPGKSYPAYIKTLVTVKTNVMKIFRHLNPISLRSC